MHKTYFETDNRYFNFRQFENILDSFEACFEIYTKYCQENVLNGFYFIRMFRDWGTCISITVKTIGVKYDLAKLQFKL